MDLKLLIYFMIINVFGKREYTFAKGFYFHDPSSYNTSVLVDIPPPLRVNETPQSRRNVEEILDWHWRQGDNIYKRHENDSEKHFTYGEVTTTGARQLMSIMQLYSHENEELDFFDLGSGVGKLVVQAFLENERGNFVGIELSEARHDVAVRSWSSVQYSLELNPNSSRVQLWNKDILKTDFSNATHIYLSSLCFPRKVIDLIAITMLNNSRNKQRLKVVAALSRIYALENDSMKWKKSVHQIQMTWGRGIVYVYNKLTQ